MATRNYEARFETSPELAEMYGKCPVMQYLARQGQTLQGDTDDESNFIHLLKLRDKDQPLPLRWLEGKEDNYTSHDIQNEIIGIMANHLNENLYRISGVAFSLSYATSPQISVTRNI